MFFIVKDMSFHPHYDKQMMTPQRSKASETSPVIKRIRLISPSPTPTKRTSVKSHSSDYLLDTAVVDDPVLFLLLFIQSAHIYRMLAIPHLIL